MLLRVRCNIVVAYFVVILGSLVVNAPFASAECSEQEHVGVFVIGGIFNPMNEPPALQIETVSVSPVEPAVYPSEGDVYYNIMSIFQQAVDPASPSPGDVVGNIWNWPGYMSHALVDRRDGAVLFAGSVIWMGEGHIFHPETSSHGWSFMGGSHAPAPTTLATIQNYNWDMALPPVEEISAHALELMRTTDVLHSFGECGEYVATSVIYTPVIGALDPGAAKLVVVIEGLVGAPWNDLALPVQPVSWGSLKSLYR